MIDSLFELHQTCDSKKINLFNLRLSILNQRIFHISEREKTTFSYVCVVLCDQVCTKIATHNRWRKCWEISVAWRNLKNVLTISSDRIKSLEIFLSAYFHYYFWWRCCIWDGCDFIFKGFQTLTMFEERVENDLDPLFLYDWDALNFWLWL